jgi:hypothetical protein
LDELIEKEKEVAKGTYREYALNNHTIKEFYDFFSLKYPTLCPLHSFQKPCNELKEKYTKLIELEISDLNYNKECLEYLINHGTKNSEEVDLENNLEIPKKLMRGY